MSYSALLGGNPLMYMGRAGGSGIRFGPPEHFTPGEMLPAGLWIVQSTTNVGTVDIEGTGWLMNGALVASNGDLELTVAVAAVRVTGIMQGPTGPAGAAGAPGAPGTAATISVGTVTDSAPGSAPQVNATGTTQNRILNFVLPRGDAGPPGATTGASWGSITGTLASQTDLNTALTGKQTTLVSGSNIRTVNGQSLLGSTDLAIAGGAGSWGGITGTLANQTDLQTALNAKQTLLVGTAIAGQNLKTVNGTSLLGTGDLPISGGGGGTVTNIATGTGLQGGPITGAGTISLANSGVTAGTFQGLTVDATGRVTAATNMGYTTSAGTVVSITAAAPLSGGTITGTGTIGLNNSGVTAGTYQGLTVNAQGLVTGATNQGYTSNAGTVTNVATGAGLTGGPITGAGTISISTTGAAEGYVLTYKSGAIVWAEATGGGPGPTPTAPTITSPNTATGTVGQTFSYTAAATGTPTPSISFSGLPGWLTQAGNTVSGTPPVGSDATGATFTVQASNSEGSPTMLVTVTIAPAVSGWSVTYNFPSPPTGFTYGAGGDIPLTSLTGWNAGTMGPDMTDANLYGPPAPANQAAVPVQLYATFAGQSEVQVPFDLFPGTPASNFIDTWGFDSSTGSIYIQGSNSTGLPIALRLVRA